MNELPEISSYGKYESSNYGMNTILLELKDIHLYYSYKTIVAYVDFVDGLTICKNDFSVTTGKHLNWISEDKSRRIPVDIFKIKLNAALKRQFKDQ